MVVATGVEMLPPAGIKRLGRAHELMNQEHRLVGSQTNDKSGGMRLLYPALCTRYGVRGSGSVATNALTNAVLGSY